MVFVIADVHSRTKRLEKQIKLMEKAAGRPLSSDDVIVVLGDLLFSDSARYMALAAFPSPTIENDLKAIEILKDLPATSLVVFGNHETNFKISQLGLTRASHFGGVTYDFADNVCFCRNGEIYRIEDEGNTLRFLALGGAAGHGLPFAKKPLRPFYHMDRICKNIEGVDVDFVIAHDSPSSAIKPVFKKVFGVNALNETFESIKDKITFKAWLYGHHHIDYDLENFYCIYNRTFYIAGDRLVQIC